MRLCIKISLNALPFIKNNESILFELSVYLEMNEVAFEMALILITSIQVLLTCLTFSNDLKLNANFEIVENIHLLNIRKII